MITLNINNNTHVCMCVSVWYVCVCVCVCVCVGNLDFCPGIFNRGVTGVGLGWNQTTFSYLFLIEQSISCFLTLKSKFSTIFKPLIKIKNIAEKFFYQRPNSCWVLASVPNYFKKVFQKSSNPMTRWIYDHFDVYLGRQFHATQELEYREIDDLHIHIGQDIQQHKTYVELQNWLINWFWETL